MATSQQIGDQALAIYQINRDEPRDVVAALLDQFFSFVSASEYEEQLQLVQQEMAA